MRAKVRLSARAESDLAEIDYYLTIHAGVRVAEAVVVRIFDKLESLAEHPRLGAERPDLVQGCRMLVSRPYLVIYDVNDRGGEIVVLRVAHGAQDLQALFADD